ncbi:MAG: 50S ribosomal protein L35 [Patescibacteria group bacterium]
MKIRRFDLFFIIRARNNMPKIKTHKATAKRFKITRNNKMLHRKAGQDHFNSRESGNVTRNKRRDVAIDISAAKVIKQLMPYK